MENIAGLVGLVLGVIVVAGFTMLVMTVLAFKVFMPLIQRFLKQE